MITTTPSNQLFQWSLSLSFFRVEREGNISLWSLNPKVNRDFISVLRIDESGWGPGPKQGNSGAHPFFFGGEGGNKSLTEPHCKLVVISGEFSQMRRFWICKYYKLDIVYIYIIPAGIPLQKYNHWPPYKLYFVQSCFSMLEACWRWWISSPWFCSGMHLDVSPLTL